MNFEFAKQINPALENLDFPNAIKIAESELQKIPTTKFHAILGQSLINQADELVVWIDEFYQSLPKRTAIRALYFEMNEIDINTDMWYIDGFAYKKDGGLDLDDMDWLCDSDADSQTQFSIENLEQLQAAFAEIEEKEANDKWTDELQKARDWSEQIIIARYMELMRTAHVTAKRKKMDWANIPIYFTEHEYDFIVKSEN